MAGFFSSLFHTAPIPDALRQRLSSEGIIAEFEHLRVRYRFSGRVPDLVSVLDRSAYAGALVFTKDRLTGSVSQRVGVMLDVPWSKGPEGLAEVSIDETGVQVSVDLPKVDPSFSGTQSIVFLQALIPDLLERLPTRSISFDIPRETVLRLAGVPVHNPKPPTH